MYGPKIFKNLNWDVPGTVTSYGYGLLLAWAAAVVFLVFTWINANKTGITEDQKKYNNFASIVQLLILFCIYLAVVVCTGGVE